MVEAAPRPLSLLVAEDVDYNRRVLQALLECEGHHLVVVATGTEAVAAAAVGAFDAILMDINMPEMNGIEAARRIRSLPDPGVARVPIIGLTAEVDPQGRHPAVGIDHFLVKPLDLSMLRAILADATSQEIDATARPEVAPSGGDVLAGDWLDEMLQLLPRQQLNEIIGRAASALAEHLGDVKAQLERSDTAQVAEAAHRLAGLAAMHGCRHLGAVAAAVEQAGRSGALDEARRQAAALDEAAAVTIAALRRW